MVWRGERGAAGATLRIIGVGNPLMGDDGLGIVAIERLAALAMPPEVELVDGGCGGLSLLPLLQGAARVLLIDAAQMGLTPGAVASFGLEQLLATPAGERLWGHQGGLAETLLLGRELDGLPPLLFIGMQPQTVAPHLGLSAAVEGALAGLLGQVLEQVDIFRREQRMEMVNNIVVLDGYTLNPGDLSWEELQGLGACTVYERTPPALVVERAAAAEIVLTNKTVLTAASIAQLPRLRYIGVLATGTNVVDLAAARARGIPVCNVPAYSTASVAQLVFALLLELTQQVGHHAGMVRQGRWSAGPDFCFWERPLVELDGLCLGIVGFGAIGRRVATLARAFGMEVLVHTAHPAAHRETAEGRQVRFVDLDGLFAASDVVTLHCPLGPATEHLVDARRLGLMKPSAYLLNTGRGPLVDEAALATALNQGRLAGAGLDVLAQEPPPADQPLLGAANCIITPHLAWATGAARRRLLAAATANVRAFLAGRPQHVVN